MALPSIFGNTNSTTTQPSIFNGSSLLNQFNQVNGWSRGDATGAVSTNGMSAMPTGVNPVLGNVNGWNLRAPDANSSTGYSEANVNGNAPVDMNTLNWQEYNNPDGWAGPLIGSLALAGVGGSILGPMFGTAPVEGLSGMDLAADAALGSGNNIITAGSMLGAPGVAAGVGGAAAGAAGGGATGIPGATGAAGGAGGLLGNIGTSVGGNIVQDLVKNLIGGGSGGVSNLGNLASLFTNYNQYNKTGDLINQIKDIYSPESPYAKYMGEQLARKDAAAGRNSQYGPRMAQLMGILGEGQAKSLSSLFQPLMQQQGGLNGMVGAGSRLLQGSGLGDWITKQLGGMSTGVSGGGLSNQWDLGANVGPQMPSDSSWDLPTQSQITDPTYWDNLWGG